MISLDGIDHISRHDMARQIQQLIERQSIIRHPIGAHLGRMLVPGLGYGVRIGEWPPGPLLEDQHINNLPILGPAKNEIAGPVVSRWA